MEREKINQIKKHIATHLLAWTWMNQQDPWTEFIPPTEEQAITEYQNSVMFNRVVDSIAFGVIKLTQENNYPDTQVDQLRPDQPSNAKYNHCFAVNGEIGAYLVRQLLFTDPETGEEAMPRCEPQSTDGSFILHITNKYGTRNWKHTIKTEEM